MTGIEASTFIIDEQTSYIKRHHNRPKSVTLSWELAMDLTKLTRDQVGELAEQMWMKGESALLETGLFGLSVTIDYMMDGHQARFTE